MRTETVLCLGSESTAWCKLGLWAPPFTPLFPLVNSLRQNHSYAEKKWYMFLNKNGKYLTHDQAEHLKHTFALLGDAGNVPTAGMPPHAASETAQHDAAKEGDECQERLVAEHASATSSGVAPPDGSSGAFSTR